jgi:hypothetical protein
MPVTAGRIRAVLAAALVVLAFGIPFGVGKATSSEDSTEVESRERAPTIVLPSDPPRVTGVEVGGAIPRLRRTKPSEPAPPEPTPSEPAPPEPTPPEPEPSPPPQQPPEEIVPG